jgi:hypothetical protein
MEQESKKINLVVDEKGADFLRKLLIQQQDQLVQIAFTMPELGELQATALSQVETMLAQLEVHQSSASLH